MSEFRVEKRREAADVTLVTGATLSGVFFLAGSSQLHTGPERVGDVMNFEPGFFPFECRRRNLADQSRARAEGGAAAADDRGAARCRLRRRDAASRQGPADDRRERSPATWSSSVPPGHDRLSDYAQIDERFRYVELADRTLLINSAHIVALTEVRQS